MDFGLALINMIKIYNDADADDNRKPTPYYRYGKPRDGFLVYVPIYWNVEGIAGEPDSNGWILQHVQQLISFDKECKGTDYFEAWKVRDGAIIYDDNYGEREPDDILAISPFIEARKRIMLLSFNCWVYWIGNECQLADEISQWKHTVPEARDLISIYANDFPVEAMERKCAHQAFRCCRIVRKWIGIPLNSTD